ncbi:hypothetical protein [Brucella sp. NBRC 113783]|uniref:hypothetical protein n=1 Tax=Brucella sp. NBRC 113783 TaxID=3075478 RepID=UPI0029BFC771|nr:hypothetical protein [Brucella sp. NBRC 113783]MDX4074626.1 hypothetical protein [Brucella sp. NBRC 113783]
MKILAWAAGVLFAIWLTAFTLIKWSDLGCSQDWTICAHETGIWFRKLVLLEWASKWQPLLAGVCAVLGGAFVLVGAREQVRGSVDLENKRRKDSNVVACAIVSKAFTDLITDIDTHSHRQSLGIYNRSSPSNIVLRPSSAEILSTVDSTLSERAYDRFKKCQSIISSESASNLDILSAKAHCFIWSYLLNYISKNLSEDGAFKFSLVETIPSEDLYRNATQSGIVLRLAIGDYAFIQRPITPPSR